MGHYVLGGGDINYIDHIAPRVGVGFPVGDRDKRCRIAEERFGDGFRLALSVCEKQDGWSKSRVMMITLNDITTPSI